MITMSILALQISFYHLNALWNCNNILDAWGMAQMV